MISNEVIIALIGVVSTVVSGWVSWFFSRKKYNSEVDSVLIENMKHSLDFYKTLADDNKDRLLELQKDNDDLRRQVDELRCQVFNLMSQVYEVKPAINKHNVSHINKTKHNENRSNKKIL